MKLTKLNETTTKTRLAKVAAIFIHKTSLTYNGASNIDNTTSFRVNCDFWFRGFVMLTPTQTDSRFLNSFILSNFIYSGNAKKIWQSDSWNSKMLGLTAGLCLFFSLESLIWLLNLEVCWNVIESDIETQLKVIISLFQLLF